MELAWPVSSSFSQGGWLLTYLTRGVRIELSDFDSLVASNLVPRCQAPCVRKDAMAKRKKVPPDTETEVLTKSRRRCCVCFGLCGDDAIKKGQIAHLDGNPDNNSIDNLAWLCFDHHDEHDGKTSQSKNFTIHEIKVYREGLHQHYRSGGKPSGSSTSCGHLVFADDPPVFSPDPTTFANNPQLIAGGRLVNTGATSVSLGRAPEVRTLDSDGRDLGLAKNIKTQYRVRKSQERLSRENIPPSAIAQLLPGCEAFIEIIVNLEPGSRFDSVQIIIACDPPIAGIGPGFPIDVKVIWPFV